VTGKPPEAQAIAVIHRALDLGVTLLNTADSYCLDESDKHHNEQLICKALKLYKGNAQRPLIITKGGFMRINGEWIKNGNPDYLWQSIQGSFEGLGGDRPIDLWEYHCPDPNYTLKQSLAPAIKAVEEGIVRFVGVSNFSLEQLKRARDLVDIVTVENQFNLWQRKPEFNGILRFCEEARITFLAWSPLGGIRGKRQIGKSLDQLPELAKLAMSKNVSVYCIMLAWLRAKSTAVIPIPGADKLSDIQDSVKSIDVKLTPDDIVQIDRLMPESIFDQKLVVWTKQALKKLIPVR
jgi:aryl-alcohol dehydrogenase-like predicted oxidoreductase